MHVCARALITACAGLLAAAAVAEGTQGGPQPELASDCRQALVDRFQELSGPVMEEDDRMVPALALLREGEKLARDVYLTFTALYAQPVFPSVAWSEQHHMDLVAMILERYGIPDPAAGNGIGEFEDTRLQELFDDLLVPMGERSLVGALTAGAIIEDLGIFHLEEILATSASRDISLFVQNLAADSRDHMRSFVGALEQQGETYFPPFYIDDDLLSLILSSDMETTAIYDEYGEMLADCGQSR